MSLSIQSRSIYHGLPVFPEELKGLTAIVAGANGISGDYMVSRSDKPPNHCDIVNVKSYGRSSKFYASHPNAGQLSMLSPGDLRIKIGQHTSSIFLWTSWILLRELPSSLDCMRSKRTIFSSLPTFSRHQKRAEVSGAL